MEWRWGSNDLHHERTQGSIHFKYGEEMWWLARRGSQKAPCPASTPPPPLRDTDHVCNKAPSAGGHKGPHPASAPPPPLRDGGQVRKKVVGEGADFVFSPTGGHKGPRPA